jgi:hypothetical protein
MKRGLLSARGASLAAACEIRVTRRGHSTAFNLFAMRRDALVTDAGAEPLRRDLQTLPSLIAGFLLVPPRRLVVSRRLPTRRPSGPPAP